MARRPRARSLGLWANGVRVGQWQMSGRAMDTLTYDSQWVASPQGRPLSLSLPFTLKIVVGRLQHDRLIEPAWMNDLKKSLRFMQTSDA